MSDGKKTETDMAVYHDETKDAGHGMYKGHVFFFVPLELTATYHSPLFGDSVETYFPAQILYGNMLELRNMYQVNDKLHFADIAGTKWSNKDLGTRKLAEIAVEALRHKAAVMFKKALSCKLAVVFYPKKPDYSKYGGATRKEKQLRYDETMMRMLLKGGVHYLYDANDRIRIRALYSDGTPEHRGLDHERIMERLEHEEHYGRSPLRNYVEFLPDAQIIHLSSDHRLYPPDDENHRHANLLQLADLLLGAVTWSCYKGRRVSRELPKVRNTIEGPKKKKDIVAFPIREMLDKRKRGRGFSYSGHYRAFSLSEVAFVNSQTVFREPSENENTIFGNTPEFDFGL